MNTCLKFNLNLKTEHSGLSARANYTDRRLSAKLVRVSRGHRNGSLRPYSLF
jgi:hypothetical protein